MSALLNSYESEYRLTFDEARSRLQLAPTQALSERNTTLRNVEQQQEELVDLIDQMEIEVNSAIPNGQERANYKAKLRGYRKQVQNDLRQPLQQLIDSTDRDLLFGEQNHQFDHLNDEQRQQLLANHSILQGTGDRLTEATRLATETEGIGSNIMNDLRSQRETLENARQTLFTADSYVDKSIRTLKTMSRRVIANKFSSYAIIAVLILLILLVLFSKFKS